MFMRTSLRWAAALAGVLTTFVGAPVASGAVGADLRVVAPTGETLAEHRQYTDTVTVTTDPGADCFGPGTGGSGNPATVPGSTALGAVADGTRFENRLRPLSVTDAFSFGLGVCGIGGFEASGESFWYLKVNRTGSQVGGDQATVVEGDDVLWYLAPSFPPPPELVLEAPSRALPGTPFEVTVLAFDDAGVATPAEGATVAGATAPTDANGKTQVVSDGGRPSLQATRGTDIPSNVVTVCVKARQNRCPAEHGARIAGRSVGDRIAGTPGADEIFGLEGADVIDVRSGGRDTVRCGRGRDKVLRKRNDRNNEVAGNCELVRRR